MSSRSQSGDQLRVVAGQGRGVLFGHDDGRVGAAEQVVLGVLDDGLDRLLLGRGGGGQVVVAFDRRAVVGVDGRPAAAGPRALSRMEWCVVRIRDRWIFNGPPSSPVTPWRATQRRMAMRPGAPVNTAACRPG